MSGKVDIGQVEMSGQTELSENIRAAFDGLYCCRFSPCLIVKYDPGSLLWDFTSLLP